MNQFQHHTFSPQINFMFLVLLLKLWLKKKNYIFLSNSTQRRKVVIFEFVGPKDMGKIAHAIIWWKKTLSGKLYNTYSCYTCTIPTRAIPTQYLLVLYLHNILTRSARPRRNVAGWTMNGPRRASRPSIQAGEYILAISPPLEKIPLQKLNKLLGCGSKKLKNREKLVINYFNILLIYIYPWIQASFLTGIAT